MLHIRMPRSQHKEETAHEYPQLFILGAQKAGTIYLAYVLADYPDVYFSHPKETMFFSRRGERAEVNYADYCT